MWNHECTPLFPSEIFVPIFDPPLDVFVMKSTLSRWRSSPEESDGYALMSTVFSPEDLGIPSRRERRYTRGNLRLTFPEILDVYFGDVFFRQLRLDATVYLVAPDYAVQSEIKEAFCL